MVAHTLAYPWMAAQTFLASGGAPTPEQKDEKNKKENPATRFRQNDGR